MHLNDGNKNQEKINYYQYVNNSDFFEFSNQ